MNNVNFDLLNNQNEREIIMSEERLDILDKVKELVFMKGTEYMTTQMVADYYNVAEGTIKALVSRNNDELIKNGYKVLYKEKLKEFKGKLQDATTLNEIKFVSQLALFNKRSILNVGMLLDKSPVAEEVRTLLLDNHEQLNNIHSKLENGEEITKEDIDKSDPLYFEKKEKELRQQESEIVERLAESIINGDMISCISISREISKIQEDLIALEKKE